MGSSKKHKEKDRDREHKHKRKHRSRSRSPSRHHKHKHDRDDDRKKRKYSEDKDMPVHADEDKKVRKYEDVARKYDDLPLPRKYEMDPPVSSDSYADSYPHKLEPDYKQEVKSESSVIIHGKYSVYNVTYPVYGNLTFQVQRE